MIRASTHTHSGRIGAQAGDAHYRHRNETAEIRVVAQFAQVASTPALHGAIGHECTRVSIVCGDTYRG